MIVIANKMSLRAGLASNSSLLNSKRCQLLQVVKTQDYLSKINKTFLDKTLKQVTKLYSIFYLAVPRFIFSIQELPGSLFNYKNNHHELLFSQNVVVSVTQHISVIDVLLT